MKKAFARICLTGLILWSFAAAVLYSHMAQCSQRDYGYGVFSVLCAVEGLLVAAAMILRRNGRRNRLATALTIASAVCAVPVLTAGAFWLFYVAGFPILPPAQR